MLTAGATVSRKMMKEYRTGNLNFGAAAMSRGYELIRTEKDEGFRGPHGGKTFFVFRCNDGELDRMSHEYHDKNLKVDALTYVQCWRTLRTLIG